MKETEIIDLVPSSISQNLPAMVKNELAKLSAQKQEEFVEEYRRKSKSAGSAYVCWLLLGWHYAYLHKWGLQVLYWATMGGFLVWFLIDLFRIPGLIRDYNKDQAVDILRNLKAISNS